MNRKHHLQETLPVNLRHNGLASTKFLILDYGSSDGLKEYIQEDFANELRIGRVQYIRYSDAAYFHRSHSRNLAARLSGARFICNLDADNFTGPGFDQYLQSIFEEAPDTVVTGLGNIQGEIGAYGRIAVSYEHFRSVGGYDEQFEGYGFEDYDLLSRLQRSGLTKRTITDALFTQVLPHDDHQRSCMESAHQQLLTLYRQQLSTTVQVLLYLFRDQTFAYGILQENVSSAVHYRYHLAGKRWQRGKWSALPDGLQLRFDQFTVTLINQETTLTGHHHHLKKETNAAELQEAIIFLTNIENRGRYLDNIEKAITRVNQNGFGLVQDHQPVFSP